MPIQSKEEYIKKCQIKHGTKYNYSKVDYKGIFKKIAIICPIHGEFIQTAHDHSQGNGCQKCATENTIKLLKDSKEKFIQKAVFIHGNKYDYSNTVYKNQREKVKIYCKTHKSIFEQSAGSHLSGSNCPQCNWDYNNRKKEDWIKRAKGKEGTFYIIKCWNEEEEFYKFGITFRGTELRYKSKGNIPYNIEIIKERKSFDLSYIWDLEKKFKSFKSKNYYKPLKKFHGSRYECFK